jgi:hypothetical protein
MGMNGARLLAYITGTVDQELNVSSLKTAFLKPKSKGGCSFPMLKGRMVKILSRAPGKARLSLWAFRLTSAQGHRMLLFFIRAASGER